MKILWATGEFESVQITKARLVGCLYVVEVDFIDGTESVGKTVKFIKSQELLMEVQVYGSMTNVALLILLQVFANNLLLVLLRR